jgi:NAD(P)-dependent dehydrogenase (short-subunit alcohol dehydrogenase family)
MNEPISLKGQTIIITGASDGVGAATARILHKRGAKVVIVGRSPQKTRAVAAELHTDYYVADFACLDDIRILATALFKNYPKIDVLINNAGLIWNKRTTTVDGHEMTFQVNHLAPFLLTNLLKQRLIDSHARIINTSSKGNNFKRAHVDLNDLEHERSYDALDAYTTSKLENIMFTKELARRWGRYGVSTASFHPGDVASSFGTQGTLAVRLFMKSPLKHILLISPEEAADTPTWLASTKPGVDWQSGEYYVKRKAAPYNAQADDQAICEGLWQASAKSVPLKSLESSV